MAADNLINIGLYGDGSRKSRRRAEYIYCDHAEKCSAYKEGKCFCVTTFAGEKCPLGRIEQVDGGTKQSKNYYALGEKVKASEFYAKLKYPYYDYVTRIEDNCFLRVPYIRIKKTSEGKIFLDDPGFRAGVVMLTVEDLTPENIKYIFSFKPRALMGGVITAYTEDIVPILYLQLSLLFPEKMEEFSVEYPDYKVPSPNWEKRQAKLSTCNRDETYLDYKGNVFHFDGDEIVCEKWKSAFLPFGGQFAEVRLKVTDDMYVTITDNNQVTADTVFA